MDIEYSEWGAISQMLLDGSLTNVKQLAIEIHTRELNDKYRSDTTVQGFAYYWRTLNGLEEAGFKRWKHHANPMGMYTSSRTGRHLSCCFELFYVNINFLS